MERIGTTFCGWYASPGATRSLSSRRKQSLSEVQSKLNSKRSSSYQALPDQNKREE
jgi:hypothetical protein